MREYATPRGQRATLQLADGSRLTLGPASRLRIPASFGRSVREVHLEAEALFDVVHDSTRPFRVRAMDAIAQDPGTRFDVRAYAEDSVVAVRLNRWYDVEVRLSSPGIAGRRLTTTFVHESASRGAGIRGKHSRPRAPLEALPERRRQVFLLRWKEGLNQGEIAHLMEIGVKTVENQMTRALRSFRDLLGGDVR